MKSHWQIAIALGLAVLVGALVPPDSRVFAACGFVGGLFLNALHGGVGNYRWPTVCEGIDFFHEPITYSAQCHVRELRWLDAERNCSPRRPILLGDRCRGGARRAWPC